MRIYRFIGITVFVIIALSANCGAQWLRYDKAVDTENGRREMPLSFAKGIVVLKNGDVLSAFLNGLLFKFNNGIWESYPSDSLIETGSIASILKDSLDNLWVATSSGLKYYDTKLRKMMKYYPGKYWAYNPSKPPGDNPFYNLVKCIAIDSSGGVWLSGMSNSFDLAYLKDGQWTLYPVTTYEERSRYWPVGEGGSASMEVEKNGTIWYLSYFGLVRYDPKTRVRTFFDTLRIDNKVIPLYASASRLHISSDGKIWLNVQQDYILNFDPKDSVWTVFDRKDIPIVLPEDSTLSIFCPSAAEDNNGDLWVTMFPDYLAKYNKRSKQWKKIQLPPSRYEGVRTFIEYGLAVDRKGQVWVGTRGEGIIVYTGESTSSVDLDEVHDSFSHTWIYSIAPNPVSTRSRVDFFADPSFHSSLRVGLYSLSGILQYDISSLAQVDLSSGRGYVDLESSTLSSGVYLLRVSNGADNYVSVVTIIR